MKRIIICLSVALVALTSCDEIKAKTKAKIKDVGDNIGSGASELGKGLKDGVEDSFVMKIEKNDEHEGLGLEFGKVLTPGLGPIPDNSFDVYVIFNETFSDTLMVKVFDKNSNEIGRQKVEFSGKKDEARYIRTEFDHRTNIDYDSKITIEKL
jgi:hypothetical protein